jgi:AraC-like DNA-binding protein
VDTPSHEFQPVRFTTGTLPERDRVPFWREFFGPSIFHTEIEPVPDLPFRADVTLRRLPGVCLASDAMSPARFARTRALVADGNDDICLFVNSPGGMLSQLGREVTLATGDAYAICVAEPCTFASSPAVQYHRCFHLHVSRTALAPLVANLDDVPLQTIAPDTEALQYLASYIGLLRDTDALIGTDLLRATAVHLRDLVALILGATRDAAEVAEARGLRAARLRAIKHHIRRNLGDNALTVGKVAVCHRVTSRYVQRLFETEGTTFSEFVLDQRLMRVHRSLMDPRQLGRTISALALEAGFGDISYFNRCFRRRFGAAPTEVRGFNEPR